MNYLYLGFFVIIAVLLTVDKYLLIVLSGYFQIELAANSGISKRELVTSYLEFSE